MEELTLIILFSLALFSILMTSYAVDVIAADQAIRDGDTIVSSGGNFELGFFSLGSSKSRYVGIWYKKISIRTVVWVANREIPLTDTSGVFKVNSQGILLLISGSDHVVWSSNSSESLRVNNPVAQILDTGNLVVREESTSESGNFIWQSFDHPGNTLLPGMKLGQDLVTGMQRHATSWKSVDDPSPGEYTVWMDVNGYPQLFVKKGSDMHFRLGPWNGLGFSGVFGYRYNPVFVEEFVLTQKEVYYKYELIDAASVVSRMMVTSQGSLPTLNWYMGTQGWSLYLNASVSGCSIYGLCGANGSCFNKSDTCECLSGFEPRSIEEWSVGDWTSGCHRRIALDCGEGEGFKKISGVKLPDTRHSLFNRTMELGECEMACKKDCSCTAYASLDVKRVGCLLWFGDLIDIGPSPVNQDLYVRFSALELKDHDSGSNITRVTLATSAGVFVLGVMLVVYGLKTMKKISHLKIEGKQGLATAYTNLSQNEELDLPLFSLAMITMATNNFSIDNKLGEGGFGPVYKGLLKDGREVAVKQLSQTSTQGFEEFKNEVICIAKLQHRNLVKLLGICIQGDEVMLIYEYMPNKSLDTYIFDESKSSLLNWPQRFHIIHGVARGLLYLHQDSRLRIIHRDLKASNILLDFDLNPKISDFGLARMFEGHETEAKTNKVVGTYGYMSPEYAVKGHFSVKSDVFSFGVLVLEIVSGKKNREFSHQDHSDSLLGHAWRLHKEGKSKELIDAHLSDSCSVSEVLRSIHVGLLCVQHLAEDRPNMASVVQMLVGEGSLPPPEQPGFFTGCNMPKFKPASNTPAQVSVNEVTITLMDAR